jgi:hypothetical protein
MQLDAIWQHDHHYWEHSSRITPRDGYAIYTNPSLPGRYDPNHAGLMRLNSLHVNAVITDIIHFLMPSGTMSVVYLDHLATPDYFCRVIGTPWIRGDDRLGYHRLDDSTTICGPDTGTPHRYHECL